MPWLLIKVIRDRPGILNEIAALLLKHGINIRNIIGNSYTLMINIEDHINEIIHDLSTVRDVEPLEVLNGSITPLAFSQRHFLMSLKAVLQQMGTKEVERMLYRLGYEYAKAVVTDIPIGDPITTIETYLYTATAYNRLIYKNMEITRGEIRIEFTNPFDEELNTAFTEGYIHGLINTALAKLHYIGIERVNNVYRAVARPVESIELA
ncbi:ACT domain-containing protein [Vulcanisaeta distributa]|uniref:ACT domain-containing protein n=1 Tax=Vulcanisaeta distributa TaxID=164451 RepID=UPI0006D038B5|nr:ACT domain-containing protein [Vulcanisaeta distributa]